MCSMKVCCCVVLACSTANTFSLLPNAHAAADMTQFPPLSLALPRPQCRVAGDLPGMYPALVKTFQPCIAGDVGTFSADDLRPLQRVKGAHMVFTTALTFSKDEQSMLTVSADASALATRVCRTPTSSPFQLYFTLAVIACILAVICAIAFSKGSKSSSPGMLSQQAGSIQEGAQRHAYMDQEF